MLSPYTEETQRILEDFVETLSKSQKMDADFLNTLRQMLATGKLGDTSQIAKVVEALEVPDYGLQNNQASH